MIPTSSEVDSLTRERFSVQAVVTYWLLVNLTLTGAAIILLVVFKVAVDPNLLGALGGFMLTVSNLAAGAVGYWLGSTASSNRTTPVVVGHTTAGS